MAVPRHFQRPPRPRPRVPGRPRAAWPRATRHPQRDATTGTAPVTRLVGRAGPPSMALPRKPPIRDRVFGFDPDLAQQEFQA